MEFSGILATTSYIIAQAEDAGILTYLQTKFNDGGFFMWPILACLVLGLGFSFERLWTLSRASMNTKSKRYPIHA